MRPTWVDRVNEADQPEPPPKSGRGSARAEWERHARALGYQVPDGASRADIIELVEAGPPPRRPRGTHRVAGEVYQATVEAVEKATHLTPMDRAAIEVLLDLAQTIDGLGERAPGSVDNWTVPTFLRYAESLGLTPAGRKRLDMKLPQGKSELDKMREKRRIRAVG